MASFVRALSPRSLESERRPDQPDPRCGRSVPRPSMRSWSAVPEAAWFTLAFIGAFGLFAALFTGSVERQSGSARFIGAVMSVAIGTLDAQIVELALAPSFTYGGPLGLWKAVLGGCFGVAIIVSFVLGHLGHADERRRGRAGAAVLSVGAAYWLVCSSWMRFSSPAVRSTLGDSCQALSRRRPPRFRRQSS